MTPENQKLRDALKSAECIIVSALAHQPEDDEKCRVHLQNACQEADRAIRCATGMPVDEEVFCSECGKKLDKVKLHMFVFGFDGSEYDGLVDFASTLMNDGTLGICINTDTSWCGYNLSEEEQAEVISCPHCGKYPFSIKHIEVVEQNQVVIGCWTRKSDPAYRPASASQGKEKVICVKCGQPVPISKAEDWDVSGSTRQYICPSCAAEEAF